MQHAFADYLSRIENGADAVEGNDDFLNGAIRHMEENNPEHHSALPEDKRLTDMSEFLNTGLPPLRTDKKKGLAVRSQNFV